MWFSQWSSVIAHPYLYLVCHKTPINLHSSSFSLLTMTSIWLGEKVLTKKSKSFFQSTTTHPPLDSRETSVKPPNLYLAQISSSLALSSHVSAKITTKGSYARIKLPSSWYVSGFPRSRQFQHKRLMESGKASKQPSPRFRFAGRKQNFNESPSFLSLGFFFHFPVTWPSLNPSALPKFEISRRIDGGACPLKWELMEARDIGSQTNWWGFGKCLRERFLNSYLIWDKIIPKNNAICVIVSP